MPLLASDIMDDSAAFLNDTGKTLFTYAAQLPYLRIAAGILEQELILNDVSVQLTDSAVLSIPANTTDLVSLLPSNFLIPIKLWERDPGGTFTPMDETDEIPPDIVPTNLLQLWTFRNNTLLLVGSIVAKEIKIEYWRTLVTLVSQSSTEEVQLSRSFLGAKNAELCARYIGENPDRANDLYEIEVKPAFNRLMGIYNKESQANRTRRRRYMMNRSMRTR